MTTPTTRARIRWEDKPGVLDAIASLGNVGTLQRRLFIIYKPTYGEGQYRLLCLFGDRDHESLFADDADTLKGTAERWLEEFVSSLGAIFPDALYGKIETERDARSEEAILAAQDDDEVLQAVMLNAGTDALGWVLSVMDRMEAGQ